MNVRKYTIALVIMCAWLLFFPLINAAFGQPKKQGAMYDVEVLRVVDGDTVVIAAPWVPLPMKPEIAVRIYGIDTPEKAPRAQCAIEDTKAKTATAFTKSAVAKARSVQVLLYDWDKYGGRVLGDVYIDGASVRLELIRRGLAREYFGERKQSWC